jgi:hypothetical protein
MRRSVCCVRVPPLLAQDPLYSIRLAHDSPQHTHGTASPLRGGSFLEPVLSNPQVKLRA